MKNKLKYGVIVIIIVMILSSIGASGYHTGISDSADILKTPSQLSSPDLIYPEDEAIIHDDTPTFRWSSVDDPSGISYTLEYSNDPTFQTSITVEDILINIYTVPIEEALDENIDYYWRVKAINGEGNVSEWSDIWQFILDLSLIVHTSTSDFESGTLTNLIAFDDEVKFASLVPSWNNRYNENIHDISRSVMVDDGNNVYITGSTGYLMYGDEGWTDFLTVKYDENGNILWNKTYNKSKWDMAYDVSSDS